MIRKLAVALSILGALNAGLVHALGLGEADVQSALNQPLQAEIELVNVNGLEPNEILPGLATREEFLRAGVDRVYFLSDIRFKVTPDENGNLVVVLTTTKPVREPFLNFLVEVIWPSGRLLREYALLLDPPVFTEEKAQPVSAPALTQSRGDVVSMPAPAPSPRATSVAVANPALDQAGERYGPTTSNDTLWDIALKARPDRSVSPQQVMLAIQDLNPGAFIDDNINKMKTGQILRLPSKDQIQQRSTAQAINEVIAQNEALLSPRERSISSAFRPESKPVQSAPQRGGDELKLVVAEEGSQGTDSAGSGQAVAGSGSADDAEAEKQLALTLEKLDKATIENNELSSRVGDLEEQLETLQRLLTLKNDQLASVQEQMRASQMEAEAQADMNALSGQDVAADQDMADTASADTSAEPVQPEETADMAGMAGQGDESSEGAESAESTDQAGEEVAEASDKGEAKSPAAVEQAKPEPVRTAMPEQGNWFDMIMNNSLYQALVGLGVIVLLVILWLVSRNNAKKEQEYYQQQTDEGADEAFAEGDNEDVFGSDSDESDFEHDEDDQEGYGESDAEDVEEETAEEEDVIAEADVYVAYGRLDQAAKILEEAISSNPVRTDYRLKLLEVYKESNDQEAFNKQFSELEAIQDHSAIEAATRIRNEMLDQELASLDDREQELDEVASADAGVSEEDLEQQESAIETEEQALDTELDNSFSFDSVEEQTDEEDEELDVDLTSEELDLDVDIDLDLDEVESVLSEKSDDSGDKGPLEYDMPDKSETLGATEPEDLDTDGEAGIDDSVLEEAESALDESLSDDETDLLEDELDVELDDIELNESLDQESEIDLPDDLSIPDELTELDEDETAAESADVPSDEASEAETPASISADAEDAVVSDDILDEAVEALGDPDDLDADLGEADDFDFLEGTDEASTKLDLARAYIDMGDVDGARDILEEVEKEGSAEQQAEAKDLLQSIEK